jgi:hypothetical protein
MFGYLAALRKLEVKGVFSLSWCFPFPISRERIVLTEIIDVEAAGLDSQLTPDIFIKFIKILWMLFIIKLTYSLPNCWLHQLQSSTRLHEHSMNPSQGQG